MTAKQFYDWQTSGGTDDVMKLVAALEKADIPWCAIGGVAVNHWAKHPMVTQDVDLVVASDAVEETIAVLEKVGFQAERFKWSVDFKGNSAVSVQLSTEDSYSARITQRAQRDGQGWTGNEYPTTNKKCPISKERVKGGTRTENGVSYPFHSRIGGFVPR